jgi:WD40 repeat protein
MDQFGDPLPEGAIVRFGTVRNCVGSERVRYSHALSPDGKFLAVEGPLGLTLWNVDTGRIAYSWPPYLPAKDAHRFGLCFSPDGDALFRLTGRFVTLWQLATGKALFAVELHAEDEGDSIVVGPGKDQILVTDQRHARAWTLDAHTGKVIRRTAFPEKHSRLIPAGNRILGRAEQNWSLLDVESGNVRVHFDDIFSSMDAVAAFAPDGERVFHLTETGRLRTLDCNTGKTLENLDAPKNWPGAGRPRLALATDAAIAYMAQGDDVVHRRDVKAGKWLPPIENISAAELLVHPDGKRLLAIGSDGVLRRFDLTALKELPAERSFSDPVFAQPSPDGKRVLIDFGPMGRSNNLHLFEATGKPIWTTKVNLPDWGLPRWSGDGHWLACIRRDRIIVRDAKTGAALRTIDTPTKGSDFDDRTIALPKSDRLITTLDMGRVGVATDLRTGKIAYQGDFGGGRAIGLFPDGRRLLFLGRNDLLLQFDLMDGTLLNNSQVDRTPITTGAVALGLSPDGSFLLTWDGDAKEDDASSRHYLGIYRDVRTGVGQMRLDPKCNGRFEWAFSPDGLTVALGTQLGDLRLFDVATGLELDRWQGHRDEIVSVQFLGSGRVITGSADQTALLWNVRPRQRLTKPAWEALCGADAKEARCAIWALAEDPKGPELLRERMAGFGRIPVERIRQLLADLGADRYVVREQAFRSLAEFGNAVEAELKQTHQYTESAEVRARLDALLAKLTWERSPPDWARLRAVAAMELAGTADARKLLAEWAGGASRARLTMDAKAALGRLDVSSNRQAK